MSLNKNERKLIKAFWWLLGLPLLCMVVWLVALHDATERRCFMDHPEIKWDGSHVYPCTKYLPLKSLKD